MIRLQNSKTSTALKYVGIHSLLQLGFFNLDFLFHVFSRTTVVCVDLSVVIGGPIHLSPRITY